MTRTSRSRSPSTSDRTLAIRTRDPLPQTLPDRARDGASQTLAFRTRDAVPQNATVTSVVGESVSTQVDRGSTPDYSNTLPHQHSPAEGETAPSIEEFRKAAEPIREQQTEEQRRRIAENEASLRALAEISLRALAEIEPKVDSDSVKTHLPGRNDMTVQSQIAVSHSGVTSTPQSSDGAVPSTSRTENGFQTSSDRASPSAPRTQDSSQTATNLASSSRPSRPTTSTAEHDLHTLWTNYYDSNATHIDHQPVHLLHDRPPCTGPCPVQTPHPTGPYLRRGGVPRTWNPQWGYSDPPRAVWDAWVRMKTGRSRGDGEGEGEGDRDRALVEGFAECHKWWRDGEGR